MSLISIRQSGSFVYLGRYVRTPCVLTVTPDEELSILQQLRNSGIIDYSVTALPPQKDLATVSKNFNLNYRKDNPDPRDYRVMSAVRDTQMRAAISDQTIDYTDQMSPVKDQGRLGSCVGFAAVAMKEWQEQQEHQKEVKKGKRYKRKEAHYDLSEQWLYYKCKEIDEWPGEEGTSIRCAMKILNRVGVPCEKAWPYNESYVGEPKSWSKLVSLWALGGAYYRIETPEELIQSLKENGPTVGGIGCFLEIFYTTGDGIVKYPENPFACYGGHAICFVGWDPSRRLFKFKNSWGPWWGQKGYGYISYNYVRDFLWDGWVIKDVSVTKEMIKEKA
ncbi:C1 family peptidase [Candidatus Pacearchaeota archaeon]|nr:C1 family peptidase [Candidatus Pacearchaeota archaeon]